MKKRLYSLIYITTFSLRRSINSSRFLSKRLLMVAVTYIFRHKGTSKNSYVHGIKNVLQLRQIRLMAIVLYKNTFY